MTEQLDWGFKYLMCAPDYFGVLYEINPWMNKQIQVETDGARQQWEALVENLRAAGAEVEFMPAAPDWPDIVFTANAGVVNGNQFVPAQFRYPERQGETQFDVDYFEQKGFRIDRLPPELCHEGAGDALPFNGVLLSGYRFRTDAASHVYLSKLIGAPVRSTELIDPRLYHLDLTFCPLDDRHAIVAPMGWDSYGQKVVEALVPEPLVLTEDEALTFMANSVVIGNNIVMPACTPRVGKILEGWGFSIIISPVNEFLKAGGGCRCLTLALDVKLGTPPANAEAA
jgi:N-dimethylarginine dimethylaminohydrolase